MVTDSIHLSSFHSEKALWTAPLHHQPQLLLTQARRNLLRELTPFLPANHKTATGPSNPQGRDIRRGDGQDVGLQQRRGSVITGGSNIIQQQHCHTVHYFNPMKRLLRPCVHFLSKILCMTHFKQNNNQHFFCLRGRHTISPLPWESGVFAETTTVPRLHH